MLKTICLISIITFISTNTSARPNSNEIIDEIMRGIGIKYIISDDRKLPKKNRIKWQASLADFIDFKSLNEGMRQRIFNALSENDKEKFDDKVAIGLADKAVLFLVPKELTNFMMAYLRKADELGELVECKKASKVISEKEFMMCINKVSNKEIHIKILTSETELNPTLVFKKQSKWRLSNIQGPISEKMLSMVARLK